MKQEDIRLSNDSKINGSRGTLHSLQISRGKIIETLLGRNLLDILVKSGEAFRRCQLHAV